MPVVPSSSFRPPRFRKTRDDYSALLSAAHTSTMESIHDLEELISKVEVIPLDMLSAALDVFLFHLDGKKVPYGEPEIIAELRCELALSATNGLLRIVGHKAYKSNPDYAKRIYEKWYKNLGLSFHILSCIRKIKDDELMSQYTDTVAKVIYGVMAVDGEMKAKVLKNESAQMLISDMWCSKPIDEKPRDHMFSFLVCQFLSNEKTCMDYFIGAIRIPSTFAEDNSERIAVVKKKALARLHIAISLPLRKKNRWQILGSEAGVIRCIIKQYDHELAKVFVDHCGLPAMLKVLRHCARHISTRTGDNMDRLIFYPALTSINGVGELFITKPVLMKKAIRGGLLDVIISLFPWFEGHDKTPPAFSESLEMILDSFSGLLTDAKVIALAGKHMKTLSLKGRAQMIPSSAPTMELWGGIARVLQGRFVILRMHTIPQKIGRCDSCKKRLPRTSLMTCGGCRREIYCSRECQIAVWITDGHKDTCEKINSKVQVPVKKFDPEKDTLKSIVLADIIRYRDIFAGHFKDGFPFRPLRDLYCVDYQDPAAKASIFSCDELVLRSQASIHFRILAELKQGYERIRREFDGKGVLCVARHGYSDYSAVMLPLDLGDTSNYTFPASNTSTSPSKPVLGMLDFVLNACGPAPEAAWTADLDRIILDIFLDNGPAGRAARFYWRMWDRSYTYRLASLSEEGGGSFHELLRERFKVTPAS